jgi:hypothetical protein
MNVNYSHVKWTYSNKTYPYADVWMYHTQLTARCDFKRKTVSPFCVLAYGAAVYMTTVNVNCFHVRRIHNDSDSLDVFRLTAQPYYIILYKEMTVNTFPRL